VKEALETIDFGATGFGPQRPAWQDEGWQRTLVDGDHFGLQEFEISQQGNFSGVVDDCAVVTCLSGEGTLSTPGGAVELIAGRTAVVPAVARAFRLDHRTPMHLLVATPKL
jgi:quercetin dioxygenase-like cupin family protein